MRKVILTGLLALAALASPLDIAAQKSVKELTVFVDGSPPPASPAEMLREADAVIVARYTGKSRLIARGTPGASPVVDSTNYTFEILETLKFDPLLPPGVEPQIEVNLTGGDRALPTHIERTKIAHTESLSPRHTYVVFLKRNRVRAELYLAWGAAGLYDITENRVRPIERERRRHEDMPVSAFLDVLRAPG